MRPPRRAGAASALLLLALAPLTAPAPAGADEPPAAAPPTIDLVPAACVGQERCRTELVEVYGVLPDGEQLASLSATVDGVAFAGEVHERTAEGRPGGWYLPHGSDAFEPVDYALRASVPVGGEHAVVVTAVDRAGSTVQRTTTVLGALPPSRVAALRVVRHRRSVEVRWDGVVADHGGLVRSYRVSLDGRRPRWVRAVVFGLRPQTALSRLRPGRHRVEVRAVNAAGLGTSTRVGFVIAR